MKTKGIRRFAAAAILLMGIAQVAVGGGGQSALAGGCGISIFYSQTSSTVCYNTIQDAVNSIELSGGTVNVQAGTYPGGVTISSSDYGITIQGQGAGSTIISGSGTSGSGTVFNVQCCHVTLSGLTVTGGTQSGIINQDGGQGGLTLQDVTVTGNSATYGGGIYQSEDSINYLANLTLSDSTVTGNSATADGGGIFSASGDIASLHNTINLVNSTVSYNCAGYASTDSHGGCSSAQPSGSGGGVDMVSGQLTMNGSTINNNTAVSNGGGVYNSPQGADGYYFNEFWTNSTVADNYAGGNGGGIDDHYVGQLERVVLMDMTVAGNTALRGGGISDEFDPFGGGGTAVDSTIIADNTLLPGGSGVDCAAQNPVGDIVDYEQLLDGFPLDSTTHNLIGNGSGCGFGAFSGNGDQVGSAANPIDPRLGSLANNGGPTLTMALSAGSPAIGAGDALMCAYAGSPVGNLDQRGDRRIAGSRTTCDIGAFDTGGSSIVAPGAPQSVSATVGSRTATVAWSAPSDNGGSPVSGYVITCSPSCGSQVFGPSTFSATLDGLSNNTRYTILVSAISAGGTGPAGLSNSVTPFATWYVNADSGQDPTSGCAGNTPGSPYKTIAYVVTNCLRDPDIIHLDAASHNYEGGFTLDNKVTLEGEGARSTVISGGSPVITVPATGDVTVRGVTITGGAQGIKNEGGSVSITAATISHNQGEAVGAAIENDNGNLAVSSSTIAGNSGSDAAAIYSGGTSPSVTVDNSTITENSTSKGAAASTIDLEGGTMTLTGDTIVSNHSDTAYGATAIHDDRFPLTMTNTILANNTGPGGIGWDCGDYYPIQGTNNIIGEACSGFYYAGTNAANHNLVGNYTNPLYPHLGPLANNGGAVDTMAIAAGSPALGAGDSATCLGPGGNNLDERGQPRNAGGTGNPAPNNRGACDIGAYDTGGNASAPAAPANLSAQSGPLSATVGWQAPNNGGSPITGYVITCTPDCSSSTGVSVAGDTTSTTVGGLTAGTQYTFTVEAFNASGAGEISAPTAAITVKTPKPNAPSIALDPATDTGASNSDGITSDSTPKFQGTADVGVTVSVYVDGGTNPVCSGSAGDTGAWSCVPSMALTDGTHTVTATADNGSGTSDPSTALTVTIDTQNPKVTIDAASRPAPATNSTAATFTFTTTDGGDEASSYLCTLDGNGQPCPTAELAPSYTSLTDGSHSFTVQVTDQAGNVGSDSYTWTVDTQAPTTTVSGSLADTGATYSFAPATGAGPWTNDSSGVKVRLNASDVSGGSPGSGVKELHYSASGAQTIADTTVNGSSATFMITGEGVTAITYFAVDNAGNEEAAKTVAVQIDATAPTLTPSVTPDPVYLNGSATADAGASDTGSGVATQSCTSPDTATVGAKSLTCTATDLAGNAAKAQANYLVTYQIHTISIGHAFGRRAIALQLQDAAGVDKSARSLHVSALCVVPHTNPTANSCGTARAIKGTFRFTPLHGGSYVYDNPARTVSAGQYDLLFTATNDPVVHAITFTVSLGSRHHHVAGARAIPGGQSRSSGRNQSRLHNRTWHSRA